MSIFANRKSKPKASFLSDTKNISQRGTLFSIHAKFHKLFDQLKPFLQCIFAKNNKAFGIQGLDPKKSVIGRFVYM